MDNPASIADVRASIERPLTPDEERVIPQWLDKAWRELNRVVPGIPARNALPAESPTHLADADIRDVLVSMVERKVRNPSGTREWRGDDYSETVDASLSSGQIYVSEQERASLMPPAPTYGGGIYSIPLTAR